MAITLYYSRVRVRVCLRVYLVLYNELNNVHFWELTD